MKDPVYNEVKEINEYADNVTAFLDLKAGRLEAFVVDEVAGRCLLYTSRGFIGVFHAEPILCRFI